MNDLTGKTIIIEDISYYVYSQLMYNREYYVIVHEDEMDVKKGTHIYKLLNEEDKYFITDDIDKKVIEKFIIFLSM